MKTQLFIKFTIVMLFFSSIANSQAWLKNLPANKSKGELTLFDYKNAFNQYWAPFKVDKGNYYENGVKKKARGWKQFKRWEYTMESQINPIAGAFPHKTAQEVYDQYLMTNPPSSSLQSASWINLGTNSSGGGYAGVGRISCIAFHPTDVNTYWVGAASGGLWVTTNNGLSWTCLTDNNGVLAVCDIVIPSDYATSNTIYIATGDKDGWDNSSIGVLKSTNGGSTWSTTGISYAISAWSMVNRLLLDPTNNQIIIAATSNGVYKTINGGTIWNTQLTANNFIDMEYKPGDFNTLYGSTQNGEIFVSANGGVLWTQAFTDPNTQRIELAVSVNQPNWVYAIATGSDYSFYGIYKSINNGSGYSQIFDSTTTNLLGWEALGTDAGGQGYYTLSLAVSPLDANTLFVGGVNTWGSVNGGTSWAIVNHWWGDGVPAVHADKHMLKYQGNGNLFECNDGGVYTSSDNGLSWIDKTNGMVISQMYKLGVSKTVSTETITGLQDNGTKLLSGGNWFDVKGGDGMECLIDYTDVNVQYGTYVNGQITRTTDRWVSDYTDIEPAGAGDGAWVTPYIIDPVNNQTLYAGYADVWKTTDRGDTWTNISTMSTSSKIRSMAIAPSNNQVLYVADPSIIWKTANGGTLWTDITGTLPVGSGNITYIAVKNDDPNTLWVTMSGYSATTVYQSVDAGNSWTDISAGLPQIPAYSIVQNKQSTTEVQLYVGTELGIYFKEGANNWIAYNTDLPNVKIGEIEIYYDINPQASILRAATYGRGLWESPVFYSSIPMAYVSSTTTQNDTATVAPNQINQEIIGIEIVTSGNLTPLIVTSFDFNTTGSTSPTSDITNAKLFYSGTSNVFAASAQFGTSSNSPNGTFTISGTQSLSSGTNYFWLTYDVPSTATLGNFVDAQCTSLTIGTAETPLVTNPSGKREIALLTYCSAGSTAVTCDEYISNVTIGTINDSTLCSTGGYADYSAISTDMAQGDSLVISVINGPPTYPADQCGIWVDWNNNGDFSDDQAITITGSPGPGPYFATIICPINTSLGSKRLRVRIHYNEEPTSPCGNTAWGEVEDYSINVTALITVPPVAGLAASNSTICSESSTTMSLTGYTGSIQWQQSPDGSTNWTNVSGGTGANTPSYTTTNLSATTYYRTEVTQPGFSAVYSNGITITVNPLPNVTSNANANILTANQAGASYQWIDCGNANLTIANETNQSYTAASNGSYAVIVTMNGCSDTSACIIVSTIGIDETKNTVLFNVYPSPATDIITITVNAELIGKDYFITDQVGKIVLSGKIVSEKSIVHINELATGAYLIRIMNHSKKVIK